MTSGSASTGTEAGSDAEAAAASPAAVTAVADMESMDGVPGGVSEAAPGAATGAAIAGAPGSVAGAAVVPVPAARPVRSPGGPGGGCAEVGCVTPQAIARPAIVATTRFENVMTVPFAWGSIA